MPQSGDRYAMPDGLGEYLVIRSHEETGGEYVEMEWTLPATSFAPPPHRHPTQTESYEILAGSLDVMIDGEWQHLDTGESATVPVGANHTFRLAGEQVRVRNFHRPGGRFDEFIARQHRFVTSPRYRGLKHPRTAVAMAASWHEHRDLLVPTNPVLRVAVTVLAPLGRREDRLASS
jgi:mannose-6-phosphate isomerase-like protein (cupin superfamily)